MNTSAAFSARENAIRVREKYEAMLGTEHDQLASRLIKNFDEALFHPSAEDFRKAASFAKTSVKKWRQFYEG